MRQWCNDADLAECSSHGLRKASATILAEAGATEHQLMAIFGWSDSKMAQHYMKAAQSKRIIDAGRAPQNLRGPQKCPTFIEPEIR
jgi:integrase